MPLYFLKRWHRIVPNETPTWHMGREVAFLAADDKDAVRLAQAQLAGFDGREGLAILADRTGKVVWENPVT